MKQGNEIIFSGSKEKLIQRNFDRIFHLAQ